MIFLIFLKNRTRPWWSRWLRPISLSWKTDGGSSWIGVESLGQPKRPYVKYDEKGHVIEEPVEPTIPLEEQALTYAQNLLENQKVRLEYDVDGSDTSSGYLYAYVYLPDGKMANAELLRMGFVKLKIVLPNVKYEDQLDMAYRQAKRKAWFGRRMNF